MAKASRVRYSGTAPFVDDTQVNRVQALGSSSRLTTEDMKELGTLNIVEIVDDVPQVDVSLDTNENGTNEALGLLANKGYGCNAVAVPTAVAIGSNKVKILPGSYYAKGQRVHFQGAQHTLAGTETVVYLLPEFAGTQSGVGTTVPTGGIKVADITVTGGILKQADIIDARPFKQIKELDFELAKVDIFVPVKQSGSGDGVARTMYMERVYANSVDFGFQVNGVASASFRMETDNKRWFLNNSAQIVVDKIVAGATGSVTLSQTPNTLANGNKLLKVTINGNVLKEGTGYTVTGKTLAITGGTTANDLVIARYTSNTGGNFFAPVPALEEPHPELAGGLKEGQIELFLVDKDGNVDAERTARVQSARISMPLTREQLDELGSSYPYDRPMQLPVNVSVSLEIKDSDLELMARFAGFDNLANVDEIALDDLVKNKGLLVKLYRETDVKRAKLPAGHPDKYAIKTFYIRNLIPQSESWDVRVDSDASQSFEFLAHNLTISDEIQN